jgi:acyl dehydratase
VEQIFFEDVSVGQKIPFLRRGPISVAHIMRWSAASENWHRIHYDHRFATQHDGLPDVMVNGSWKQNMLIQLLNDWVGQTGWLWRIDFQFRAMNVPGETLTAWGVVEAKAERGPYGLVDLKIGLTNEAGVESTPGNATVVLASRDGPAIPRPFDPHLATGFIDDSLGNWAVSQGLRI